MTAIVITGIIGAVPGPFICRLFSIKDSVAVGVAIGTASHALGTIQAIDLEKPQGQLAGLQSG